MSIGTLLESTLHQIVKEALLPIEDDRWQPSSRPKQEVYEWTWSQLDAVRRESRRVFRRNEFAIGGTDCRIGYACGDGFQYEFVPRAKGVGVATGDLAALNSWLSDFCELNNLEELEEEVLLRCDRDGEAFLRLFPGEEDDMPEVRFVEPERVNSGGEGDNSEPTGTDRLGIITATGDSQRVEGYWIEPEPGAQPERVEVDEVVHFRANTDSSCRRGCPVYFPVFDNLNRCEDLLLSMSAAAKARAKIAILIESMNLSPEKADEVVKRLTSSTQTSPDGSARRVTIEDIPFGAIVRTNAGDKWTMPSATVGAGDLVAVLQADLRAVGSRMVMPEWMFTGLADQKYSNAFVVEAPTLKRFRRLQRFLRARFGEWKGRRRSSLVWKALVMSRRFESLLPAVKCKVTPPSLESRDKTSEASTNRTYVDMGVKDVQLVQEELGIDPEVQQRIALEKQKAKEQAPPAPGSGSVSQPPTPSGTQPGTQPPAADALLQLLNRTTESLTRIAEGFAARGEWQRESLAEPILVGGEWWEPDALSWVTEGRDRSHLVRTATTRRDGVRTYVWRRPNSASVPVKDPAGSSDGKSDWDADRAQRLTRVQSTLAKPADEGLRGLTRLADDLTHLTRDQIRDVVRSRGLAVGGKKRDLAERLLADAKKRLDPVDQRIADGDPNAPQRDNPDSFPRYSDEQIANPDNIKARADVMGLLKRSGLRSGRRVEIADLFRETGLTEVQMYDALGQLNQVGALNLAWRLGPTAQRETFLPNFVEAGAGFDQWTPDGSPPKLGTLANLVDIARDVFVGTAADLADTGRWLARQFGFGSRASAPAVSPYSPEEASPPARATVTRLSTAVEKTAALSTRQKARYTAAAGAVVARIPDAGQARLESHLADTQFHADSQSLTDAVLADVARSANGDPAALEWASDMRSLIASGRQKPFGGAFVNLNGRLHLDGPSGGQAGQFGTSRGTEEEVYAHELGHAIDGPKQEYSRSEAWQSAWTTEIAGGDKLTKYAASRASEGFAEFARLLYGTGHERTQIEAAFPQASRFFKERGLWPS